MVTLNIAHEINFLSLSDHMDILKTGTVNVNGRSYSVQSCGSEGVIRLKQTDLAHASFLTRFISSVREFFTGEKKQLEHTINVMKQHSLNIDKVRAKIAELASPAGTVSQPLYAKIEDLAKEMGELNDRGMTQLKFKSAQLADLIDIYSECYPHAVMMDNEMPELALKSKSALTENTLSELNKYYLNIKNDFENFINGKPDEGTLQNLAEEAGQLKQRSECYEKFVNILYFLSLCVDQYYTEDLELMGCADWQIHPKLVKSGLVSGLLTEAVKLGVIDIEKDFNSKESLHDESLEKTKNIPDIIFSECAKGKKDTIEKINKEITNVLPGAKNGKDVSAFDAILKIAMQLMDTIDYFHPEITEADPKTTETVFNRILVIINDYELEDKILKYSGLGDILYDTFQNGKSELLQGLRDANVEQIKKGIDTCDEMKVLLEAKFAAAEKLDTQLTESKKLLDDCLEYIGTGKGGNIPIVKDGSFLNYINAVTITAGICQETLDICRKMKSKDINDMNDDLGRKTADLRGLFDEIKTAVRNNDGKTQSKTKH